MKKLIVALAAALAVTACSAPAEAQTVTFSFGSHPGYYQDRNPRGDYRQDYRQNDRYEYRRQLELRRFFARQPSYYPGRCERRDVIVRDPFTQRTVCVDRRDYREFERNQRNYDFPRR